MSFEAIADLACSLPTGSVTLLGVTISSGIMVRRIVRQIALLIHDVFHLSQFRFYFGYVVEIADPLRGSTFINPSAMVLSGSATEAAKSPFRNLTVPVSTIIPYQRPSLVNDSTAAVSGVKRNVQYHVVVH